MNESFPVRPESHQLEELSERFFRQALPKNWTVEKPNHDYGVDLRVDLFEGTSATGLELLVQMKSSAKATEAETETVQLRIATYNLLWGKLQVAMLVKFIEAESEAYWLLLKDIPAPSQDQETFVVHIPKKNRLSTAPWVDIQAYVRSVTDTKLAGMRLRQMQQSNAGA